MAEVELRKCEREECTSPPFSVKSWNQKYCSEECTRIATNRRIMEKYYDKKDRLAGKVRLCASCKDTRLSRYNNGKVCSVCEQKQEKKRNEEFFKALDIIEAP